MENFLNQKFEYSYRDLYDPLKLKQLCEDFYKYFENDSPEKYIEFIKYRDSKGEGFTPLQISQVLIDSSVILSQFLTELFNLYEHQQKYFDEVEYEKDLHIFKKDFIQRRVYKKFRLDDLAEFNWSDLDEYVSKLKSAAFADYNFENDEEKYTAKFIEEIAIIEKNYRWFYEGDKFAPDNFQIPDDVKKRAEELISKISENGLLNDVSKDGSFEFNALKFLLSQLEKWLFTKKYADKKTKDWIIYFEPEKLDYSHLVEYEHPFDDQPELLQGPAGKLRSRNGFGLTDNRMDKRHILNQVDYCMFCHDRNKDSCSKGFFDRFGNKKVNPLGIELNGCPLEEKISEMHFVRKMGYPLASLSLVMIDNPMVPGTGHRICNDCMKGCIFQVQEPVNIPEIETSVLTDILKLPYGFEIYSLLTRWNPINIKRPYALPYNGHNVAVIGMGPAGYTLSQYLINEGFGVAGFDALKIEPVHQKYTGIKNAEGFSKFPEPVKYFYNEIEEELDKRILQGFGGVSEYGITVRWDKNFLTAIYIVLSRRENFRIYDGVRFGGTLTIDDMWTLGFDHIAIATGAGKPTIIDIKNNLIRGIRKASDFLMALQLTGAAKKNNLANLQVQLPAIVIGGGLTAIDTATELMAYYPVQVLKVLEKYEELIAENNEDQFMQNFSDEDKNIMQTFIEHGKLVRQEINAAKIEKRSPDFISLIKKWGGVTIVYRKRLVESPAYKLNHEEVIKALEEGIFISENLAPVEAIRDEHGAVKEIIFEEQQIINDPETNSVKFLPSGEFIPFSAKTVMVAAGTSPNIIYEKEYPGTFELDDRNQFFRSYKTEINSNGKINLIPSDKGETGFFTSYEKNGKLISYYGDNHPKYAGNVVKAMASAKDGYEKIVEIFCLNENERDGKNESGFSGLVKKLDEGLTASVVDIVRLTPTIIEVIVKAPFAARKFHPGQFYRLQNYEVNAGKLNETIMTMEGLAMTGAWTDKEKGLLSLIVLEMGASSRMCIDFKKGERVVVMGPTGTPTEIPEGETVLLAGGGLGNAVLFSIADALKRNGNKVIYFAAYKTSIDVYKMEEVEAGTDLVVWSYEYGDPVIPNRPRDLVFKGNIVEAMNAYADGSLGNQLINFGDINRMIVIGSDGMMAAVREARYTVLNEYMNEHIGIASINSAMQCMMKEICAQCLQKHVDPITGEESYVFTCFNQDQLIDKVDFTNLNERLKMNSAMEKLSSLYLSYLFSKNGKGTDEMISYAKNEV